jgi:CheY-like chemotaxis protein
MSYPRKLSILVVEDDIGVQGSYKQLFRDLEAEIPHNARFVTSHAEAKQLLDGAEIFHVVIVDLNLPMQSRQQAAEGIAPGEQLLETLAARDEYPVPVVLVVTGRLNEAQPLSRLQDRSSDFWHFQLVTKGLGQMDSISRGLIEALRYVDVGVHLRENRDAQATLTPREEDLLRRWVLDDRARLGVDLKWWSVEAGPTLSGPSRRRGPTKVLMGVTVMDAVGSSLSTFFKLEAAANGPFARRDIGILAHKLSHIKVFGQLQSRTRSLLVTQSATSEGTPVSLAHFLRGEPSEVGPCLDKIVGQISGQLAKLGDATDEKRSVPDFIWSYLERDKLEAFCRRWNEGSEQDPVLAMFDRLKESTDRVWASVRICNHGDLNATNIAIDLTNPSDPHAFVFDAGGMGADISVRDLAYLEVTSILFNAERSKDGLMDACASLYSGAFLPVLPTSPSSAPSLALNLPRLVVAIRKQIPVAEWKAYSLCMFSSVLAQAYGLQVQPIPNNIRDPKSAYTLSSWAAAWLERVLAGEEVLFAEQRAAMVATPY